MVLFQSVDLEGSTGYKQRLADGQNQKWRQAITDFLEEFPQCYRSNYDSLQRKKKLPQCPQAVLWKVLGDELVFKAEVTRGAEVSLLTTAFREALGEYNSKIDELQRERRDQRSPDGGAQLRVKGSSWTAGFPVTNAVIHTGTVFDYIGPSMDMGFRLGALATPQRLAISVELAWLLGTFDAKFPFHFAGRTTIKGVSEGVGYPYLWIEIPSSTYYERELDLVGGQRLRPHVIADLCYHFIKEHGVPGYLPFLISESEKTAKPSDYNTRLKSIQDDLRRAYFPDEDATTGAPLKSPDQRTEEIAERLSHLEPPPKRAS